MRKIVPLAAFLFSLPLVATAGDKPRVLVELFTSQGCSSCPPADEALSTWGMEAFKRGEVLPLAFHVDYWDSIGWKDPFSSPAFSERQRRYAAIFQNPSVYTPQAVVAGAVEFVGSDRGRLARETGARRDRDDGVRISLGRASVPGRFRVTGTLPPAAAARRPRLLWVLFQNGRVTPVSRGENGGRELTNDFVVRRLEDRGPVAVDAGGRFDVSFEATPPEGGGVGVFLQDPDTLSILAAQSWTPDPAP